MVKILFAIFESGWRRAFGSGNYNRVILHIINVLATSLYLWYKDIPLIRVAFVVPVFEVFYWTRPVGMYQDIGNAGLPDEKMLKRYNSIWYNKFLDKWFSKNKYSDLYDFVGLTIRYSLSAFFIAFILNSYFWVAGILVACGYAFFWKLYNYGYVKYPTRLAELLAGLISGLLII